MIDTDILTRIKNVYSTCSPTEQKYLQMILQEISATGESSTYRDIWLADYKEIPVGIDTFVTSDRYMGLTNQQGRTVYPFWRKTMREIFDAGNKYEEIVFTGATRIGKTSTAVLCAAYMLYRLMCLRDPQRYFGKKDISKFSIMFFNITKDLAKGVAFREFNDSLQMSPWFCLRGDVEVLTDCGYKKISDIVDTDVSVYSYMNGYISEVKPEFIKLVGYADELIEIELEDGTIIAGTPNHRLMLSDGSYKRMDEMTEDDDIMCLN